MLEGTTIEIGMIATALALVLAGAVAVFGAFGRDRAVSEAVARRALCVNFGLILGAFLILVAAFVTQDFSVAYVANNSNSRLPLAYRAVAVWGAHEGSLMLWLLYLVGFSALAVFLHQSSLRPYMRWTAITLALIQVALIVFILLLSNPFVEVRPGLADGSDLNPLLQDPGLIVHPPMLYMGYVGFSVPFALAIAALARGETSDAWVRVVRRWVLFSWAALTVGIMLGGYWSYYELGWGGYWAWDPVENASLMPWLTATALLHATMAQERRGFLRVWNLFLLIATFSLCLMGTFLVRSGIITSVHSFAVDPGRGVYILAFLAITMAAGFGLLARRVPRMQSPPDRAFAAISRESALLYNNLLFLVALGTVFFGTMLSLIAEFLFDVRLTVSAPYFNTVMIPLMLLIVLLMGIGPAVPWRGASVFQMRRRFTLPTLAAGAVAVLLPAVGVRDWVAVPSLAVVAFALASIGFDVVGEARIRMHVSGKGVLSALGDLLRSNRQRYGGLTVHLGVLVVALGVIGSGAFREEYRLIVGPGDQFTLGDYVIEYKGRESALGPNYVADRLRFALARDGAEDGFMYSEKREFPWGSTVTSEAGIRSGFLEDIYLSYEGLFADDRVSVRAYRNPLVNWIWIGGAILLVGVGISLSAPRRPEGQSG